MSRLLRRGSIALAAGVLALFASGAALAQTLVLPSPREPKHIPGPWVSGAQYDIMNREQAEHRLRKLEEKLRIDAARGDSDAAADDARRIGYLRYRIAVDVWLIRKFAMQDPGCYPLVIDESSLAYLAQAARPAPEPDFPQIMPRPLPVPAPTVSVVIANAETKGDPVPFTIDGITHMAAPGSLEKYDVVPGAFITFESGASVGERRYQLVPGVFEFRSTPHGWELYTVSDKP